MSTMSASRAETKAAGSELGADLFQWKSFWIPLGVMFVFYSLIRFYEEAHGFSAGLDSFSEEFKIYWLTMLWIELPLLFAAFIGVMSFLWKTRDRNMDAVTPREELRRFFTLLVWLSAYASALYWGASFFTEQDGAWHQTVVRDTDFTPSHIIEFYLSYPVYIVMGCGAFMYAKTRIPLFAKGFSVPFLLLFIGPFMIFPNVGLNEWGHTFWFMEEIFVAPLHWGFVFFGWMALAVFGVTLQILGRVRELVAASGYEAGCTFSEETAPAVGGNLVTAR
jgi:methane/ammonia monooxygenase subunit C